MIFPRKELNTKIMLQYITSSRVLVTFVMGEKRRARRQNRDKSSVLFLLPPSETFFCLEGRRKSGD
jgi:hypothetical protein